MKVRIIIGAVGPDGIFKKGEERELPDVLALQLIKDNIAEAIAVKPEEKKEVADSAQFKKRHKR